MPDASSIPALSPTIRFRLRTLLLATTAVAGVAAITGALLRFPPATHEYLLVLWGLLLGGLVATYGRRWQRRRAEVAAAGPVRFVLRQTKPWRAAWRKLPLFWMIALLWPLSVLYKIVETALMESAAPLTRPRDLSEAIIQGLILSTITCIGSSRLVDFIAALRAVRLCDRGLLTGDRFLPWHAVSLVLRDATQGDRLKLWTWSPQWRYEFSAPAALRHEVEAFLREKSCLIDEPRP